MKFQIETVYGKKKLSVLQTAEQVFAVFPVRAGGEGGNRFGKPQKFLQAVLRNREEMACFLPAQIKTVQEIGRRSRECVGKSRRK